MTRQFFLVIGLVNIALAVVILSRTENVMAGIGVLMIGLGGTLGNGYTLWEVMKHEKASKSAGVLDEASN